MTNGGDENSPVNGTQTSSVPEKRQITVTINRSQKADTPATQSKNSKNKATVATKPSTSSQAANKPTKADSVNEQRLRIYQAQLARQQAPATAPFPIEKQRDQFIELARFETAVALDRRGIEEMDALYTGYDHLYLVDDLIQQILRDLPDHPRYAWEATSRVRNYLNLPTVGVLPRNVDALEDNRSIMCYTLTHFGVASYTNDRAIFMGNIAGYLLMSYYFAHLKIQYGVTPLKQGVVNDFTYVTPTVESNTQCVSDIPMVVKKKIYQLAVFCARLSLYRVDKAIEKMLITEVNDFDKKKEQRLLDDLLKYGG